MHLNFQSLSLIPLISSLDAKYIELIRICEYFMRESLYKADVIEWTTLHWQGRGQKHHLYFLL